eukprot:8851163-Alexandrium_andersonii.AAC.1
MSEGKWVKTHLAFKKLSSTSSGSAKLTTAKVIAARKAATKAKLEGKGGLSEAFKKLRPAMAPQ